VHYGGLERAGGSSHAAVAAYAPCVALFHNLILLLLLACTRNIGCCISP
jgi:hypothetical protein